MGPDIVLGGNLLALLADSSSWIYRRAETVTFHGEARVKRQVSIDFELPEWARDKSRTRVPLTLLAKRPLVGFSIWDESGNSLPMLTRGQNAPIAWSVLVAAAELMTGGSVTAAMRHSLWLVANAPLEQAEFIAQTILREKPPPELDQDLAVMVPHENWDYFEKLVRDLSANFLLIVDLDADVNRRRIVKLVYDEPLELEHDSLWSRIGWDPSVIDLHLPTIAESSSYHFELVPPEGLEAGNGSLAIDTPEASVHVDNSGTSSLVHLYAPADLPQTAGVLARAVIGLRPPARGLARAAVMVACLAASILVFGAFIADRLVEIEEDAGAALLLAVPATAAAYLARPREHHIASELLRGVRVMALLAGLSLYVGAGALVLVGSAGLLRIVWLACGLLAAGSAGILAVTMRRARQ